MESLKDIPIVKATLAYDDPHSGETTILIINQALYFGTNLSHMLFNPNQLCTNGIVVNDTNLQHHYVRDGAGSPEVAGLGLPPSSLTDGALPGSEVLFKQCLHEVKALYDSQLYLKNPNATDVAAARLQAQVLDTSQG